MNAPDKFMAERIQRRQQVRDAMGNIIEAAQTLHKHPDSEDIKLWLLEEIHDWLGEDDLAEAIRELQPAECLACGGDCEGACDALVESHRGDGGLWL